MMATWTRPRRVPAQWGFSFAYTGRFVRVSRVSALSGHEACGRLGQWGIDALHGQIDS